MKYNEIFVPESVVFSGLLDRMDESSDAFDAFSFKPAFLLLTASSWSNSTMECKASISFSSLCFCWKCRFLCESVPRVSSAQHLRQ